MKTFLLKISLFIFLIIFLLKFFIDPKFEFKDTIFKETMDYFYASKKDSIDLLVFGSSHALNSYNPKIIDSTLQTYSFNLSSAAQKLLTSQFLLEDVLQETNPTVVILDVFYFSATDDINEGDEKFQFIVFNNTKNTLNKFSTIYNKFGFKKAVSTLSSTIKNHNNWTKIGLEEELKYYGGKINTIENRGFLPLKGRIDEKQRNKHKDFYIKEYNIDANISNYNNDYKKEKNRIIEVSKLLKKRNINLVLVSSPYLNYFSSKKNQEFHSVVKQLSDSLDVKYLDFNAMYNLLDIDFDDFNDEYHLNEKGSNKISAYLAKYISLNYNYPIENEKYIKKYIDGAIPRSIQINEEKLINFGKAESIGYMLEKSTLIEKPHLFYDRLKFEKINIYTSEYKKYLILKIVGDLDLNLFDKYQFGLHLLINKRDFNDRPNWMLGTDEDKITRNIDPLVEEYLGEKYLVLSYKKLSEINNFKKLKIFLKDKGKYKGVIGEPFEIDNVTFEN